MTQAVPTTAPAAPPDTETQSRWTIQRIVFLSAGVLGGIIAVIFGIGLLLGFTDQLEVTASRIQYFRNIFIIVLTFEGILIIGSLAVLIIQITRLVNMLKRDVKPVLTTAKETVDTAKGTVEFVGDNAVRPIIRASAFMSGVGVVLRDMGGIRRAIRRTRQNGQSK